MFDSFGTPYTKFINVKSQTLQMKKVENLLQRSINSRQIMCLDAFQYLQELWKWEFIKYLKSR
jgi:hypothetical protein